MKVVQCYTMLYNVIHAGPTLNIRIRLHKYITHGFHQPKRLMDFLNGPAMAPMKTEECDVQIWSSGGS